MAVTIGIEYAGDLHCAAKHGPSGQQLSTDAPVDNGGRGEAFSPTDLVATALGSCIATVMAQVADRHGLDLDGMRVNVVKEMTSAPRRRIGSLGVTVTFPTGGRFSPDDRARLERTADLCPVRLSLHPDVVVTMRFVYPE